METQTKRIDLTAGGNLDQKIKDTCDLLAGDDFRLAGCFESQNQLILIFQRST